MPRHTQSINPDLALEYIGDLYRQPFPLRANHPLTIGRAADSDIVLLGETVSRRHASVAARPKGAFITDLGSTHGTTVNSLRLLPQKPTPIAAGDLIQVGPFSLRVILITGNSDIRLTTTAMQDDAGARARVHTLVPSISADRRLMALTQCISKLDAASNTTDAAQIALSYALDGSGYSHAAILRQCGDSQVDVIASKRRDPYDATPFSFSRSLISAATTGQTAVLAAQQTPLTSNSLIGLNIHSALCAPIRIGDVIAAYLYLDARDRQAPVEPDAAGFCDALATAIGLCLANLTRADLEKRQTALATELSAAQEVQQFLLPDSEARHEHFAYGMHMRPGAYVAGDLFDVVSFDDGRTAIVLGDVAGHGAGSAMLMAWTQAHLNAQLTARGDPAAAIDAVNRLVGTRQLAGRFISLWVGVIDAQGNLEVVDAGHGHWLHMPRNGTPVKPDAEGSIPLGVSTNVHYASKRFKLEPRDRILVYTDGLLEQKDSSGERFGMDRLLSLLSAELSPARQVRLIVDELIRFSGQGELDDDATIVCIEYGSSPALHDPNATRI
ncbi:MAG: SpoIIE family protein phosphatase [Phycisphaerales bacterium]|nr:SpoIIE family protein phosphatase [Phycisphaerales bacterium]